MIKVCKRILKIIVGTLGLILSIVGATIYLATLTCGVVSIKKWMFK